MGMGLIFIDIETTGLDSAKDVPLELAIIILDAADLGQFYNAEYVVRQEDVVLNKLGHISESIHGITRDEIRDGYNTYQIFLAVSDAFNLMKISKDNSVFIAQNPSFDRQFFNHIFPAEYQIQENWPYHWLDLASMFWATEQAPEHMLLSKDNIADRLGVEPELKPHRAMQGVKHLIKCYLTLQKKIYEKRRERS